MYHQDMNAIKRQDRHAIVILLLILLACGIADAMAGVVA